MPAPKREPTETIESYIFVRSRTVMSNKVELRRANLQAWKQGKSGNIHNSCSVRGVWLIPEKDPSQYKNLDSNIKKNTAFIKKCKTSLAADSAQQLINDIKKLSLEKYISEVVGGVLEGMLKCKSSSDIAACVEVRLEKEGGTEFDVC